MVLAQKQTCRSMEQNRSVLFKPEMDPQLYGQLIFNKAEKKIQWKKDSLFNKLCWENWTATCRRMKLYHTQKIDSKWMKDLYVRKESIKILEENTGSNLCDLGHSNFLIDTSPEAKETKAKTNYWDFIKIKSFCTAKERVDKTKRKLTEWKKIFANDISDKGLISKVYKELSNSNTPKPKSAVKKWAEDMKRHFPKKTYKWLIGR